MASRFSLLLGLLPVRLDRLPEVVVESLVVGVAVLHDDGGDPLRMLDSQTVADRCAVVLHVDGVLRQPELLGELVDHLRQVVERVSELVVRRHRAVAVAGIVRRDHVILVGQRGNQIAEHLRAGRKAVEQQTPSGRPSARPRGRRYPGRRPSRSCECTFTGCLAEAALVRPRLNDGGREQRKLQNEFSSMRFMIDSPDVMEK